MSLFTDEEIDAIEEETTGNAIHKMDSVPFARAIEAAVIRKLAAGVSVEPLTSSQVERILCESNPPRKPLVTLDQLTTAIAAARVQENERCAKFFDENDTAMFWGSSAAKRVRAMLGKEAT